MSATTRVEASLAAAVQIKCAVHAGGLVGGIGLRARDPDALQDLLAAPEGPAQVRQALAGRLHEALQAADIVYGIQEERIDALADAFVEAVAAGSTAPLAGRVAEGDPPQPAQDGSIEYPLNHRGLAFAELSGLGPRSRRRKCTVVHAGDVLAVARPPTTAEDGTSVLGDRLPAPTEALQVSLGDVAGPHTVVEGDRLLAECDGLCEEDAEGWLRVVPEILLQRVDQSTGRVPESGLSEANIAVVEAVAGGGVATSETLFVGVGGQPGTVEGHAGVLARHLVVHGDVLGDTEMVEAGLEVSGTFVALQVRNRAVAAQCILVAGDCHFARFEAEGRIRVDGDVHGGLFRCGLGLEIVGDLGTAAGGSQTTVALAASPAAARRTRRTAALRQRHRAAAAKLQQELDDLERRARRRAKADAFWARLLDAERPAPAGPVQMRALAAFTEYHEHHEGLGRRLHAEDRALAKLGEDDAAHGAAEAPEAIAVAVGGSVYGDVTFDVTRTMSEADGRREVAFALEGERCTGRTLADVRALLLHQVSAYREEQAAHIEARRQALEELHRGREGVPAAPTMADHTFSLAVTWEESRPEEAPFSVAIEVRVRALEPDRVLVCSRARLRQRVTGVTVHLGHDGARGTFRLEPEAVAPTSWQRDDDTQRALTEIVVHGVTATDLIAGSASLAVALEEGDSSAPRSRPRQ